MLDRFETKIKYHQWAQHDKLLCSRYIVETILSEMAKFKGIEKLPSVPKI